MHIALPLILSGRGERDVPSMNSWHNLSYSEWVWERECVIEMEKQRVRERDRVRERKRERYIYIEGERTKCTERENI